MSLNQFLAVGRSFVGIRGEKSPFEMKKGCTLPTFESSPRFATKREAGKRDAGEGETPAAAAPVQTDWIEQHRQEEPAAKAVPQTVPVPARPAAPPVFKPVRRSWLSILSFGWLGRRNRGSELVQGELSLEKVTVLRNDLSDSDLELVLKKRSQARKASATARPWSTSEEQQPWSKLASRLFEAGKE
jgi:hypothetical protein